MSDKNQKSLEAVEEIYDASYETFSATSFSELMKQPEEDQVDNIIDLSTALRNILWNIKYSEFTPEQKKSSSTKAVEDFMALCNATWDMSPDKPSNPLLDAIKSVFKSKKKTASEGIKAKEIFGVDAKKDQSKFMIFKDNSDNFRWIAMYSNNFRDVDNPPEIISAKSHKRFVEMVDNKEADYPELWHWHIPGTKWGTGDFVAFDEESGFAIASGTVDVGHEDEAKAIQNSDVPIILSHGMPKSSIVRDSNDKSVIIEHITKEISDLPEWAAANKLTEFIVTEEKQMGLPDAKKDYLRSLGVTDEMISAIESGASSKAKAASEAGIESKEKTEPTTPVTEDAPVAENKVTEDVATDKSKEDDSAETPHVLTMEEVSSSLVSVLKEIVDPLLKRISDLEASVKEVKEKSEDSSLAVPTASLAALMARDLSSVGSKEASIRKDNKLTTGPKETESTKDKSLVSTGNAFLDGVINGVIE